MNYKTNEEAVIDCLKKIKQETGWSIQCKFIPDPMSVYDAEVKINGKLYLLEHKDRNFTCSTLEIEPYSNGLVLERQKYDDIVNVIEFNTGITNKFIYISTLSDGKHYLYLLGDDIKYEVTCNDYNKTTDTPSYKKRKYVYLLPINKAKVI